MIEIETTNVNGISNYDSYLAGMSKSYMDKLFFMDKAYGINGVLDFGCADGTLLREMYKIDPELNLIGYDNNENMIEIAKEKSDGNFLFSSDLDFCKYEISCENTLLNLSSVIHEIYSYSRENDVSDFWKFVCENNFSYIAIRDFCVSESINRPANINDIMKVYNKASIDNLDSQLGEYENIWGSIMDNRNLVHFLLKYRYTANWTREVRENYFALSLEDLLKIIPSGKYEIVYFNHYVLPFTYDRVKTDFDIRLHDNTHVQILLKRK